jgi:hypothetical protein
MRRTFRRAFVVGCGSGAVVTFAGCLNFLGGESGSPTRTPPRYDCDAADRPAPSPPASDDAVEPRSYPPISNLQDGVDGVVECERTFRRNSLVASEGESLVGFGTSNVDATEHDAPDGANVVRVEYEFYYETEEGDDVEITDSPTITASYYVDDSVVIRAEKRGQTDDGLDPDPWTSGEVIECSE